MSNKPEQTCSALNTHSADAGSQFDVLHSAPASLPLPHVTSSNPASEFSLQAITSSAVRKTLQAVDCRKKTGENKLDPYLLRLPTPLIAEHLPNLITGVFSSGLEDCTCCHQHSSSVL